MMRFRMAMVELLVFVVCAGATSSLLIAGQPAGFEEGKKKGFEGSKPHGFTQGEKKGWEDEYPPGWDKKSEKEKVEWNESVKKGREKVAKTAKKKGFKEEQVQSACDDLEKAARKGLSIEEMQEFVLERIQKGVLGTELSKAVAEETDKRIKGKAEGKDKTK